MGQWRKPSAGSIPAASMSARRAWPPAGVHGRWALTCALRGRAARGRYAARLLA